MFRPVAYMSLRDAHLRQWTLGVLERAGWLVIPQPSADALVRALAGAGAYPWLKPGLVIVDAGASAELLAGLRALGCTVPVVLAAAPGQAVPLSDNPSVQVVEHGRVADVVAALARPPSLPTTSLEQSA